MTQTAVGLYDTSATADGVVALLLATGFSRDEVKLIKRSDFDPKPSPDTDILKLSGVPAEHAGRYWEAVRGGRTLIVVAAGDRADRAINVMDAPGAVFLGESVAQPVNAAPPAAQAALASPPRVESGFYPARQAAQVFVVT